MKLNKGKIALPFQTQLTTLPTPHEA